MKQKLIVAALIVAGLASIAYAAFSSNLIINGTATTTPDWDVKITNIAANAVNSTTGATDTTAPVFTDTSATFDVELAYPGASATYDITVTNAGSIDAILSSITPDVATINGAAPTDITYEVTGVTPSTTTLNAGATNTVTVKVTWNSASTVTTAQTKTATITLNYVQNT